MARELEPYGPPWIEEPVPPVNVKAWRRSPPRMRIPVATGERVDVRHELREHFERQAADVLQTDITGCGGLPEARKIVAGPTPITSSGTAQRGRPRATANARVDDGLSTPLPRSSGCAGGHGRNAAEERAKAAKQS